MRPMRMLVMFDLPTGNKAERKSYAKFRKFLLEDGYHMEQYSIYSRILMSRDSVDAHTKRLKANLPQAGAVFVLTVTEKQYESREVLVNTTFTGSLPDLGTQLTVAF